MIVNLLSWLFPARWGMAALASTVSLNKLGPAMTGTPDTTWNHDPRTWLLDMALLLALGAGHGFVAWRRLAHRTPGRRTPGRRGTCRN